MFRITRFAGVATALLVLGEFVAVEAQSVSISFAGNIESHCKLLFQGERVRRECAIGGREPAGQTMLLDRRLVAYAQWLAATAQDARCGTLDGVFGQVSGNGLHAICDDCLRCHSKKLPAAVVARWRMLHELHESVDCAMDAPRTARQELTFEDSLLFHEVYEPDLEEVRSKPVLTGKDSAYVLALERKFESKRKDAHEACRNPVPMARLVAKADSVLRAQGAEF